MTTKASGTLRIITGLLVVLSMVVAGILGRSPWIVILATPLFTVLYAAGKFDAWRMAWRLGGAAQVGKAILVTLPIQAVVAGVFYLIGLGISMVFGRSEPLAPLAAGDWIASVALFVIALGLSAAIIVAEAKATDPLEEPATETVGSGTEVHDASTDTLYASEDVELDIDPRPLTPENFFLSPGYWKYDALKDAIEKRGATVVRPPLGASDAALHAAETRLGVTLPEALKVLYRRMDGGYVGEMYVSLKADPEPVYDDWRGAFAIDYSSLVSLDTLDTVFAHYQNFSYEDDELPKNSDRMLILQARYGDMTLLDYSAGPEPRVLIVDFERNPDDPVHIAFDDFDAFFAALRRPKEEQRVEGDRLLGWRTPPLSERPMEGRAAEFWLAGDHPHRVANIALSRKDGSEPMAKASDALIAETEARLGVRLPAELAAFWKDRNGGGVAYRHLRTSAAGEPYAERDLPERLLPLEYMTTMAALSDRIIMPEGVAPLASGLPDADKLVVLEISHDEALLLDYRNGDQPAVILAGDVEEGLDNAIRCETVSEFLSRLRAWKARN